MELLQRRAIGKRPGPNRNAMSPPQLPADTPIALFRQPLNVRIAVAYRIGMEGHVPPRGRAPLALGGIDRDLRQPWRHKLVRRPTATDHPTGHIAHAHKPLLGQIGFNNRLGAIRMAHLDIAGLFAL